MEASELTCGSSTIDEPQLSHTVTHSRLYIQLEIVGEFYIIIWSVSGVIGFFLKEFVYAAQEMIVYKEM